ncbi:hypothetical protein A2U01_0070939, partial [Trifolium medium]|nr:hypothetical protein [Trifolium medium]
GAGCIMTSTMETGMMHILDFMKMDLKKRA